MPPPSNTSSSFHTPPGALTAPLLLWLTIQFIAILTALLRVRWAVGYPQPAELLAARVVVLTQITASALLFHYLLRDVLVTVTVVATAWPFIALAGVLSGVMPPRAAAGGCYVTAWLAALGMWNRWGRRTDGLYGVAVAALLTLGTLVLFYLRLEFAPHGTNSAEELARRWSIISPPLAAIRMLGTAPAAQDFGIPAAIAGAAVLFRWFARRSHQVIHNSQTISN